MSPSKLLRLDHPQNRTVTGSGEITRFMENNSISIATVQKTKLNPHVKVDAPNYVIIQADRAKDSGGGLAFILHHSIKYRIVRVIGASQQEDTLAIAITAGKRQ